MQGDFEAGGTVISKSGTNYIFDTPFDDDDDCEFARPLLIERVSRDFVKNNTMLKIGQLDQLNSLIDKMLTSERM